MERIRAAAVTRGGEGPGTEARVEPEAGVVNPATTKSAAVVLLASVATGWRAAKQCGSCSWPEFAPPMRW